jgi:hypothetical protein
MAALRVLAQSPSRSAASISVIRLTASACAFVIFMALNIGKLAPDDQFRSQRDSYSPNFLGARQKRDKRETVGAVIVGLSHKLMVIRRCEVVPGTSVI